MNKAPFVGWPLAVVAPSGNEGNGRNSNVRAIGMREIAIILALVVIVLAAVILL